MDPNEALRRAVLARARQTTDPDARAWLRALAAGDRPAQPRRRRGFPTAAAARIWDAFDRCAVQHDGTRGGFVAFVWVTADQAEQVHHGTTDYALAAWHDWRKTHPGPVKARGVPDYLVPDPDGNRTIAGPALVVEVGDDSLALTGCTWGYGGEGPHGSALVLTDAGLFPDLATAREVLAALPGGGPWFLPAGTGRRGCDVSDMADECG